MEGVGGEGLEKSDFRSRRWILKSSLSYNFCSCNSDECSVCVQTNEDGSCVL